MKIILSRDIPSIGKKHDVKDVNDGYARNFLLPRGFATLATSDALQSLEAKRAREERGRVRQEAEYRTLAEKLSGITLRFKMKMGGKEKTFGSVSKRDIADALKKQGIATETDWMVLDGPIKTTGEHTVPLNFPYGIKGEVKVTVEGE